MMMIIFFLGVILVFLGAYLTKIWFVIFLLDLILHNTPVTNYDSKEKPAKGRQKIIGWLLVFIGFVLVFYSAIRI